MGRGVTVLSTSSAFWFGGLKEGGVVKDEKSFSEVNDCERCLDSNERDSNSSSSKKDPRSFNEGKESRSCGWWAEDN
ncbi:hypothetical protein Tco_0339931 [Tanacetum coccineum]